MKISVAINFCTNDYEFIGDVVRNCSTISSDIHVGYCDHFLDGQPENKELLNKAIEENSDYAHFHKIKWKEGKPSRYWHNHTRATLNTKTENDWVLFLDSDEVIDPLSFTRWMIGPKDNCAAYAFLGYWYFRSKLYQALAWERTALLINTKFYQQDSFYSPSERWGLLHTPFNSAPSELGRDGKPMFHHYSWAKGNNDEECKEKLLKKIQGWGHNQDRNWKELIEKEFEHPFNGTDFVHGYKYRTLKG